jgi:hypothetical protein
VVVDGLLIVAGSTVYSARFDFLSLEFKPLAFPVLGFSEDGPYLS